MASIFIWRMPVSSRKPKALLTAATLLLLAGPAPAQESCGKLYENQDCGPAAYEEALARQKEAEKVTAPAVPEPPMPEPAPNDGAEEAAMRQRALELYRARVAAMGRVQCCHPGVDGSLWCH